MSKDAKSQAQALAEAFCAWPLPQSVCADQCATDASYAFPRSGTNLLTVAEAKAFFDHLVDKGMLPSPDAAIGGGSEVEGLVKTLTDSIDLHRRDPKVGSRIDCVMAERAVFFAFAARDRKIEELEKRVDRYTSLYAQEAAERVEQRNRALSAEAENARLTAELAALRRPAPVAGVPVGHVVVPVEPTEEMVHVMRYGEHDAKRIAIGEEPILGETPWPRFGEYLARTVYKSALAAAPPVAPAPELTAEAPGLTLQVMADRLTWCSTHKISPAWVAHALTGLGRGPERDARAAAILANIRDSAGGRS